jgi:hypothetical protein
MSQTDDKKPSTAPVADDPEAGVTRREFVTAVGAAAAGATLIAGKRAEAGSTAPPTPIYRIHPAFAWARIGNADPDQFFIGPEVPGMPPQYDGTGTQVPPYKVDQATLVKPQAARFRIWEYRWVNGRLTPYGEVNLDTPGVLNITWNVQLANRKSSFFEENGPNGEVLPAGPLRNPTVTNRQSLESNFGPRTIAGRSHAPVEFRYGTSANPSQETVVLDASGAPLIDYLGQLRTDGSGRLIVIGGKGKSGSNQSPPASLSHWSNNNGWFDDASDGPVTATVTISDGKKGTIDVPMDASGNAWVFSCPPDFAPRIGSATTLYDVLLDMAVRYLKIPAENALYDDGGPLERVRRMNNDFQWTGDNEFLTFQPDFTSEIQPLLQIGYRYRWVTSLVNAKHGSLIDPTLADPSAASAAARKGVFVFLRPPDGATDWGGVRTMPKLYGDNWYHGSQNGHFSFDNNGPGTGVGSSTFPTPQSRPQFVRYATVTRTQYGQMKQWALGNFTPPVASPPASSTTITPHGLDRAQLENCVGAPFYPGIECGWQIRNPALFKEPFRLSSTATSQYLDQNGNPEGGPLLPGHFSRQGAVPWQADFNDCVDLLNLSWWPSQRPDDVFLNATDTLQNRVPWSRPDTKFADGATGGTTSTHLDMVQYWFMFGFVLEQFGGAFVETERAPQIP